MRGPWPRRALTLAQVRRLKRYATHRSARGSVFEYERGLFWVTPATAPESGRVAVTDHGCLPRGPWYHHSLCACEACAPTDA